MVTDNQAIEKAVSYFRSLPQPVLGNPQYTRLEEIKRLNGKWIVVLSYLTSDKKEGDEARSAFNLGLLGETLKYQRQFKEFEIDAESGDVLVMKTP